MQSRCEEPRELEVSDGIGKWDAFNNINPENKSEKPDSETDIDAEDE